MSTKPISLSGFLNAEPGRALEAQINRLRGNPGVRVIGVVELERHKIEVPDAADEDPTVHLRISGLELAKGEQEHLLRDAMVGLHLNRTASGTLTEDGDVELAQDTLERLPDRVTNVESARLRAALEYVVHRVEGLAKNNAHNDGTLRRELKKLAELGVAAITGEQLTLDGEYKGKPARKAPVPVVKDPLSIADIPDRSGAGGAA